MEPARSYRQQQEFRPGTCTVVFLRVVRMAGERATSTSGQRADGIGSYAWSSEVCKGLHAGSVDGNPLEQRARASACLMGERKKIIPPAEIESRRSHPDSTSPEFVWLVIN